MRLRDNMGDHLTTFYLSARIHVCVASFRVTKNPTQHLIIKMPLQITLYESIYITLSKCRHSIYLAPFIYHIVAFNLSKFS